MPYHSNSGIFFDDFIERTFSWKLHDFYIGKNSCKLPYTFPWVGVLHNPPNGPEWFDNYNSPQSILNRPLFTSSLKHCKCIVVLSEYMKDWLSNKIDVPVISVKHPTGNTNIKWEYRKYLSSKYKNVIQIGYWLRKFDSICNLKVPNGCKKYWMPSNRQMYLDLIKRFEAQSEKSCYEVKNKWANTEILPELSNLEYDEMLSSSIGFADLYDSSANNAVVECIMRNTPMLVNRIPATEEYLGKDYPFYFDSLDDCFDKINNKDVFNCHKYLKEMNKDWILGPYFTVDLINKLKAILQ